MDELNRRRSLLLLVASNLPFACQRRAARTHVLTVEEFSRTNWADLIRRARGSDVTFGMWAGDDARNRHIQGPVASATKTNYGITLRIVPASDTGELVNKLLNEKRAGKTSGGSLDIVWINGENFRAAKHAGVLWGPFASRLPNIVLYDEQIRQRDFGTPIDDYEAPWQSSQFVLAYDSARFSDPPRTIDALRDWIRSHPGRFTYIALPDFTGSVFARHILVHFGGGPAPFQGHFNDAIYRRAAPAALAWLNDIKPYLWRRGETYPPTIREQDRLFANGEIDFAMSYGPNFASQRIARGEFPPTTRTFVFDDGAIGNYNYLAIPFNAANVPGALVVINELMSFDQVLALSRVLGSPFPQRLDRLTPEQRAAVDALPRGPATLSVEELARHFIPEPDAAYLERFEKDWMEKVLRQ